MDIKQLKKDTDSLLNIEKEVRDFKKSWLKQKDFPQLRPQLQELNKFLSDIQYAQIVNEKLKSLAHYLVELKVAFITNDEHKSNRLINKFISDPEMNIRRLVFEVPYLESQISIVNTSYHKILETLTKNTDLEVGVTALEGNHKKHLNNLISVSQDQKKLLSAIGKNFVDLTRKFKK